MNRYYTDIALDENWQPAVRSNGDFATVSDLDCLMQEIRLEALTTQGELFFDPEFGWSLPERTRPWQRNTAHAKSRSYTGRMTSRTETAWRQR